MIQLLFLLVFAEGVAALLLTVKAGMPRELVMKVLDRVKAGKAPGKTKTVLCILSVISASVVACILQVQNRRLEVETVTPVDRTHLLEASLVGFALLLALAIDRLHHYLRKLSFVTQTLTTFRQDAEFLRDALFKSKEKAGKFSTEIKRLHDELSNLAETMQKVQSESEEHEKRAIVAEAQVSSLRRQWDELLLEYDRLLEDNQNLQTQALHSRG